MCRRSNALRYLLLPFVLLLAVVTLAGCSSGSDAGDRDVTTSLTAPASSSTTSGYDGSSTTTVPPVAVSDYDKELAKTATVQRDLMAYLTEEQAADGDPRFAIVYGLRVRSQAITGRQALEKGELDVADAAMREVYSTLNRGKAIADGTPAEILAAAYAAVEKLGIPSEDPERAAPMLDDLIDRLEPMLEQATAASSSAGSD